ncbi:hypothetical protein DPMN_150815 [Dreissena polymorpha]|uniref:Uncharacterized protein n=1 Tax=Dreissena polymorpha TaxID=45954 RepID=A0A9D4J6C4_DREPO|nr:hypothetical protein DPMN_150815 [Dreissena polymorpha]
MPDVVKDIDESHVDEISKCQRALSYWKDHSNEPNVWSLVDALRASNCDIVAGEYRAMMVLVAFAKRRFHSMSYLFI